jgi:hypothetical protein
MIGDVAKLFDELTAASPTMSPGRAARTPPATITSQSRLLRTDRYIEVGCW